MTSLIQSNLLLSYESNLLYFILEDSTKRKHISIEGKHILDMYRKSLIYLEDEEKYRKTKQINQLRPAGWREIIPQATELCKMGIKFKPFSRSLLDVWFDPKERVLHLPYLKVSNDMETHLLNVMAFEKLYLEDGEGVLSYVRFMKNLIANDEDVLLLASYRVLSSNETGAVGVVEFFNRLAQDTYEYEFPSHLIEVSLELNKYYYWDKPWTRWWVNLRDPRTQKPWVIISFAAASFTFLLQIIQTTIPVYEHFRSNH